jgi:hypothetical protein
MKEARCARRRTVGGSRGGLARHRVGATAQGAVTFVRRMLARALSNTDAVSKPAWSIFVSSTPYDDPSLMT